MSFKKVSLLLLTAALTVSMTACGKVSSNQDSSTETVISEESESDADTGSDTDTDYSDDSMFTNRDKEIGYDETTATVITLSDGNSSSSSDGVAISGDTITITEEGTYILRGSLSNGQIIVDADSEKVQLVLDNVTIANESSAAIYVKQADKVFITLTPDSENTLSTTGEFVAIDDNNIDGVIFSKGDLTLNGNGSLTISCAAGHGIVSKDDLVITSGTYNITAKSHALEGKDSVRIADGTFTLTSGKDGIHADNEDDETKGFIYIADGTFTITCDSDALDATSDIQILGGSFTIQAGDDGMHADGALRIADGTIQIAESCEGLEGKTIEIEGGEIHVTASDDGLNATDGSGSSAMGFGGNGSAGDDVYVSISGGKLYVNAGGDGLDSNGNLYVSGGETYVSGPTSDGDGALDYEGDAQITGGIVVAAGSSGMAVNFGENSTQGSILVNTATSNNNAEIVLTDSDGNILVSYTPEKSYSSVVISCPEITVGSTYTLTANGTDTAIEMTSLIYGAGNGMGMGGGFGGPGSGRDGMQDGNDGNFPDGTDGMPNGDMGTPPDGGTGDATDGNTRGFRQGNKPDRMPAQTDGEESNSSDNGQTSL